MINQEFCSWLEYKICRILAASSNEDLAGFWCDGVLLPDNYTTSKIISTTAFIGKTGQDKYELRLKLNKNTIQFLSKNGTDFDKYFQNQLKYEIDVQKRIFELYL